MANLSIQNLNKVYQNGFQAVEDFNLELKDEEIVVFCGTSGCGKSTVLRMISGQEEITSGEIFLDGMRVNDIPVQGRNTAMVFRNYALYPKKTVYDNLAFGLKLREFSEIDMEAKVMEVAEILSLVPILDRKIKALSEAQKLRLALGRAMIIQPQILLIGEPLTELAVDLRVQLQRIFYEAVQKMKLTAIYMTSDPKEALELGIPMVLIKNGKIMQKGTPQEMREHPVDPFVTAYFGFEHP